MKLFRIFGASALALALLLPLSPASAMVLQGGEEFILPQGMDVDDDLYAGAGSVVTYGEVRGDLIVGGGNVTISNTVTQDVMAGGGNVTINADVGDDVRVAGGNVLIMQNVAGDVVAAGGTVHILQDAVIEGDLAIGGGLVRIDGTVRGNIWIAGGQVNINGRLEGEVRVQTDETLAFGPGAVVVQQVRHHGRSEATVTEGAQLQNGIAFTRIDRPARQQADVGGALAAVFGAAFLLNILALVLAGVIAVVFLKKFSGAVVQTATKNVGGSMLRGFGFLILTPIALLLILFTFVGAYVAFIGGAVYLLALLLAKVFAGIILGAWIMKLSSKNESVPSTDWKTAVLGIVALEIITLIPIIGWIAGFLMLITALGALYSINVKRWTESR